MSIFKNPSSNEKLLQKTLLKVSLFHCFLSHLETEKQTARAKMDKNLLDLNY